MQQKDNFTGGALIMKKTEYIAFALSLLLIAGAFAGCAESGTVSEAVPENTETSENVVSDADYSDAYEIKLSDSSAETSADGVSFANGVLTITKGGDYIISGSLSDGRIYINAADTDKVKLILNGVSVTSSDGPAIYAYSADKLVIELAAGTENTLSDSESYSLSDDDSSPDSCIYAKCDIKLKGSGSLTVNGNSNHGIHSKDDIEIEDGNITVNSANDGIKGKDSVEITGGSVTVVSAGDGIVSNSTDEEKGYINISGGNISVTSGGGAAAAEKKSNSFFNFDSSESSTDSEENVSCKGIKAASEINISGGTLTLDCCDDAVHSNGNITVSGGEFNIKTGDDVFHADSTLTLSDGTCTVSESYEGLEGMEIYLSGGTWNITSSDDGMNAAGGSDSSSSRMQDMFAVNENNNIYISGGYLYINAEGDGIDSNGNVYMSGGEVYVDGPVNGGNGALDFNGVFEITDGTLISAGSSDMAQTPSDSSEEYTLAVFFTSDIEGGTEISLKNSDGDVIAEYTPSKKFSCVTITSPLLTSGETVTLFQNGEELCSTTLDSTVTKINENGEASSGGFNVPGNGGGQFGGFGGKRPDDNFSPDNAPADFDPSDLPDDFDPNNKPDMNGTPPEMPANGADGTPPQKPDETTAATVTTDKTTA